MSVFSRIPLSPYGAEKYGLDTPPTSPRLLRRAERIRMLVKASLSVLCICIFGINKISLYDVRSWLPSSSTRDARFEPAYLDTTRSLSHKAVIQPSVTFELNTLDATGLFPEWYGSPSKVGLSPFDYILPEEWQTQTRWVFVVPEKQDTAHQEIYDLIATIQDYYPIFTVQTVDRSKPPTYRYKHPDILLTFAVFSPASSPNPRKTLHLSTRKTTHVHVLNECRGLNCTEASFLRNGQITLARHAFELMDIFEYHKLEKRYGQFPMQIFAHAPYTVDHSRYYPLRNWQKKAVDILDIAGVLGESTIESDIVAPENWRRASICVFSSGKTRQMTREWIKAMLSGCVIVSDMPTESEEALSEFIIPYEHGANSSTISAIVEEALKDESRLKRQALHAFIYARQHFTPAHQIGRMLQLVGQYKAGVRGYDFPMPFSLKCREYEDGYQPGWCRGE